jgi:restriction system protein
MAIPPFQNFFAPLLREVGRNETVRMKDAIPVIARELNISEEDQKILLPSGGQFVYVNRAQWAKTFLKKAGLIDSPLRGSIKITARGQQVLKDNPPILNNAYLNRFDEFREFRYSKGTTVEKEKISETIEDNATPQEIMESAYRDLIEDAKDDLLSLVKSKDDKFFEQLVVDLVVAMGYGGSVEDAGKAIGQSGDAGVDGVVKEDRLGLDAIYIQAKKWDSNTVGRPEIQKFAGALQGQRARKGIFITTSSFSGEAKEYVKSIDSKIALIDGRELAQLMYDFNVGVSLERKLEIKKIDSDFFEV